MTSVTPSWAAGSWAGCSIAGRLPAGATSASTIVATSPVATAGSSELQLLPVKDPERYRWVLEQVLAQKVIELEQFRAALERSPYDVSPCMICGLPVVTLPDGMPLCDGCGPREQALSMGAGI